MKRAACKNSKGFTLVEIAIAMVIFGLLLGGLMGPLKMQLDNMKRRETIQTMDTIKQAIIGFALRNGRIPCPDTNDPDNLENLGIAACATPVGTVPWATLGVRGLDAWKRPFTYRVDPQFADRTDGTTSCPDAPAAGISFQVCAIGDISVLDSQGGNQVAVEIPAIIVSHGRNWAGPGDADENDNRDNDTIFIDKTHINQGYDDLVAWIGVNSLIAKMVAAGQLP